MQKIYKVENMSMRTSKKTSCKPSALSKIVKKDKARILVQL